MGNNIGVGASSTGPVLARPLLQRFNEIHYKYIFEKLCAHIVRAYYNQTTSKVLPMLLNNKVGSLLATYQQMAGTDTCIY